MIHPRIDEMGHDPYAPPARAGEPAPGNEWGRGTSRLLVFTDGAPPDDASFDAPAPILLNGLLQPPPMALQAGVTHRFRVDNRASEFEVHAALLDGGVSVQWRLVARDGAPLPAYLATMRPASLRFFPGELHEYEFMPREPGELTLCVWRPKRRHAETRVPVLVREG